MSLVHEDGLDELDVDDDEEEYAEDEEADSEAKAGVVMINVTLCLKNMKKNSLFPALHLFKISLRFSRWSPFCFKTSGSWPSLPLGLNVRYTTE